MTRWMGLDALILPQSPVPVLALRLQCPELSRRDPLAAAYGPASPAARPWAAAVPSVVPVTANPSPGRRNNCHRLLLPRQYLAPAPGLGHSTWAAWLEDARDWPGTCRPAPHFPEGPVTWPGMGSQSQEGELESLTGWGWEDGWRDCGPFSAQRQPMVGTSSPSLSPFLSLAHRHRKARPHAAPSPSPRPHCPSPRPAQESQGSFTGGHMTQACGLAQSAFDSVVV